MWFSKPREITLAAAAAGQPGIVIGRIFRYKAGARRRRRLRIPVRVHGRSDRRQRELEKFETALELTGRQIRDAQELLLRPADNDRKKMEPERRAALSVLESHLQLLNDPAFTNEVRNAIRDKRSTALEGVTASLKKIMGHFMDFAEAVFRDKARDMEDLLTRLQYNLGAIAGADIPPDCDIVYARAISPHQVLDIYYRGVRGIVLESAAENSHEMILIRALRIPCLHGIRIPRSARGFMKRTAVLDSYSGVLLLNASDQSREMYAGRSLLLRSQTAQIRRRRISPVLASGERICLRLNIDVKEELQSVDIRDTEGVGLYRSEFLLLKHRGLPDLNSQIREYADLFAAFGKKPVTVRLFDLGGDKNFLYEKGASDSMLGVRGIRWLIRRPGELYTQIQAIYSAGASAAIRPVILIPMLTSVHEFEIVRRISLEVARNTSQSAYPLSVMLESPASVDLMRFMNSSVAGYSVGSNDLIQYISAVDRRFADLAELSHPLHESVLCHLERIVRNAGRVPVSLCGEMAQNPRYLPVWLALGIREFSIAPGAIPVVAGALSGIDLKSARNKTRHLRKIPDVPERIAYLTEANRI